MDSQPLRVLQKKRTTNFREDETKLLIQLWGSPQIQNKLYLTHRKAPVMRLLAANMQHRGFYRTPDEIKTRLRNLKCLYHRIKRSMQTGVGRGTVDPDWPHYKAMDDILSRKNPNRPQDLYKDGNIFEGPRCEDIKIKQEIIDEELEINDDMESYTTNSIGSEIDGEFEDEPRHMPPLIPAPQCLILEKSKDDSEPIKIAPKPMASQQKVSTPTSGNIQIPLGATLKPNASGGGPTLPFPLLILNGLPNQNSQVNLLKKDEGSGNKDEIPLLLKSLVDVQKENLEIQKERLELEKQKLEFHKLVGNQLLTLLPIFGGLVQKLPFFPNNNDEGSQNENEEKITKNGIKRKRPDSGLDILKDSKILRNVLEEGIKKYMLGAESERDDSGVKIKDEKDKQ